MKVTRWNNYLGRSIGVGLLSIGVAWTSVSAIGSGGSGSDTIELKDRDGVIRVKISGDEGLTILSPSGTTSVRLCVDEDGLILRGRESSEESSSGFLRVKFEPNVTRLQLGSGPDEGKSSVGSQPHSFQIAAAPDRSLATFGASPSRLVSVGSLIDGTWGLRASWGGRVARLCTEPGFAGLNVVSQEGALGNAFGASCGLFAGPSSEGDRVWPALLVADPEHIVYSRLQNSMLEMAVKQRSHSSEDNVPVGGLTIDGYGEVSLTRGLERFDVDIDQDGRISIRGR